MTTARWLELIGTIFGIAGAVLIAANIEISGYGWIGFAISSVTMTGFAYMIKAWGLLALQLCFCATNVLGLWRWLIQPALTVAIGS